MNTGLLEPTIFIAWIEIEYVFPIVRDSNFADIVEASTVKVSGVGCFYDASMYVR